MHVRIQGWIPYECQIYINGREWLARQLDQRGIGYVRYDNSLLAIDDLDAAAELCDRFAHRAWPRVLNAFARRLNPILPAIRAANYGGYYWVLDQAEIATDVMFTTRPAAARRCGPIWCATPTLEHVLRRRPRVSWAASCTRPCKPRSSPTPNADHKDGGSVIGWPATGSRSTTRPPSCGWRPRSTIRASSGSSASSPTTTGRRERRWCPMRKGVSDLWRNYQVGIAANHRYLDALAAAPLKGEGVAALDALCRPRTNSGRRHRPLQSPQPRRPRPVPRGARRRARHPRVPQHRHHQPPLPTTTRRP